MQKINVLSFKDLKQRVSIEQVLRHYDLFASLTLKGKSHRGPCPFCEASDGTPFSVSLEKNCYQCFTCKASGNILDFVSKWEGVNIREAGKVLFKNFVEEKASYIEATSVEKLAEREVPPTKKASSSADEAGERADNDSSAQAPAAILPQGETPSQNEPLTFALKNIEPVHPSVKALGIQEGTLTAFGVGYYSGKGIMENRIVIPIYNLSRQLVAYAGFHPQEHTYTYPPKFRKELELYNLGGALAEVGADQGLILIRHPLEVLTLVSVGYLNAVALMGDTVSKEQKDLLLCEYKAGERVTLLWPLHVDIVPPLDVLYPDFFIRLRRYEARSDIPSGFTAEEARELLA